MNERILPELLPGDLLATPPYGPVCRFAADVMNAQTFHWGLIVHSFLIDSTVDYEIMESIPKGTAIGLLKQMYKDVPIRIYRVKVATRPDERQVEWIADSYGRTLYGFRELPGVVLWWLNLHFVRFLNAQPPALDLESAICTGFVTMVWRVLGVELVPEAAYPTPEMLEKSPLLECIYGEF